MINETGEQFRASCIRETGRGRDTQDGDIRARIVRQPLDSAEGFITDACETCKVERPLLKFLDLPDPSGPPVRTDSVALPDHQSKTREHEQDDIDVPAAAARRKQDTGRRFVAQVSLRHARCEGKTRPTEGARGLLPTVVHQLPLPALLFVVQLGADFLVNPPPVALPVRGSTARAGQVGFQKSQAI